MAEAKQKETKPEAKDDVRQLNDQSRLQLSENARNEWSLTAEFGTTLAQVMHEGYFAHFAPRFKPFDKILVHPDEGIWYAELLVLTVARTYIKTTVLLEKHLTSSDVDMTQANMQAGYEVNYGGTFEKYRVVRTADRAVLHNKCETARDAQVWLDQHIQSLR